jgi:hypothetical protein
VFPELLEFASWAAKGRALEVIHEEFEAEWGLPEEMGLPWDSDSDSDPDSGSDDGYVRGGGDADDGMIEIELEEDSLIEIDISRCR